MADRKKSTVRSTTREGAVALPSSGKTATAKRPKRSVYADYEIWTSRKRPKWHPIKKMRYVFFRMISGCTITDALAEIRWTPSEFWYLLDLKRDGPFQVEYANAKKYQARAFADSVMLVAEGRDSITHANVSAMRRLVRKGLRRAGKMKNRTAMRALVESLLGRLDLNDQKIISRNKLQIDGAKWMAKTASPTEFGDTSKMTLGGIPDPSGKTGDAPTLRIQFVGPDGKVVKP